MAREDAKADFFCSLQKWFPLKMKRYPDSIYNIYILAYPPWPCINPGESGTNAIIQMQLQHTEPAHVIFFYNILLETSF